MIERIGKKDIYVRNYTNNFDVKQFIQDVLMPKAFPDIPMNKLNLGFTGVMSEMVSQAIEDSFGTAALMMNESFITRAVLPSSIYSEASLYDLGYTFAVPSRCNFLVQLWLDDIIKYSSKDRNSPTLRYRLDRDTRLLLGETPYRFDYDIIIDHTFIDGRRVFNVYYDMTEDNSIAIVNNKYIKHQTTPIGWLILFVTLQQFDRKTTENPLSDNRVTVNSDILLKWSEDQIAGLDLTYITPRGERLPMKKKNENTRPDQDPFAWYSFFSDNIIKLRFSNKKGFFQPAFNSKIESTIYTCKGKKADFDTYDRKAFVPVQKTGVRFEYNANTRMTALCYGGSTSGLDKGDIETLRDDVILAHNTANALSTDDDLKMWFKNLAKRHGTKAEFFKRRDDPTGRLFSQFIAITDNTYVYPTNTLTMDVEQDQFDFVNSDENGINREFIIKPGHLWEYIDYYLTEEDFEEILNNYPGVILTLPTSIGVTIPLIKEGIKEGKNVKHNGHSVKWRVVNGEDVFFVESRDKVRMIKGTEGMAMITDEALPPVTVERPFMFVNPFYIKIHRSPTISANYNYLLNHTSWPENIPIDTEVFYQFQLATFSIERSLSKKYNNMYRIQVICAPVVTTDNTMKYVEGIGDEFPIINNNLRLVLITRSRLDGETGYIEMKPIELRNGGAVLFETTIAIHDNLRSDMMLELDLDRTPEMKSLLSTGPKNGKVFVDSNETSFHFAVMMKDFSNHSTTSFFDDDNFKGYIVANRFANDHRDLTLYKPMTMMRSVITFAGCNDNYKVRTSLIPFLKYDIPLDENKMSYFIRAFGDQYKAMEPVLRKFDGNSFLDLKLFNTYGRSNNYYIGPQEGSDVLWDSEILLDNVYVKIKFRLSVYDRSIYVQTVDAVINEIKTFFESLNSGDTRDVHVSDLIHIIKENQPNVHYIRFLGFNDYDANKQSIFTKYDDISELREDQLQPHVPEMIRVDSNSIEIIEEV